MKRTLRLAAKGRFSTSPNPMVGAVIVKSKKIISENFHRKPGDLHAEALAIENADKNAHGSTLYVNLEPCCHLEKRTPPCTKAIINAGIKEVVVGMIDPNPKVSGKGILELQKSGIKVKTGILEDKAKRLNETYIKYITTGKPFMTLKIAMTLDGKIATPEGQSKWITGEKSRKMVHRMRASVDAIITAIGTVKADDPQLTARIKGGKNPKRIIIDPDLEIPLHAKVLQIPPETIIVTRTSEVKSQKSKVEKKKKLLSDKSINIIEYEGEKVNLDWLIKKLGEIEMTSVLIEGGSSLNAHALEDGIVDKILFFIAPKIIGGRESFPSVGGRAFKKIEDAYRIKDLKVKKIGEDILIEGYIK
ncbi:MAG: bifunctional diaminohydroxyphosphoribosylaminopyrimidine deaminase/5-amino-6-(5-phosphoribosylamino)uracil reductase RibD [Nitrospirota bacterium]|nr:bifunctional diaminohydroxyphosphoribosylaminopyrimidine deaminase/5-amino-6-(5-phosphoribosylamino)uracil reductase RibD [Nitrospirota bacterium]